MDYNHKSMIINIDKKIWRLHIVRFGFCNTGCPRTIGNCISQKFLDLVKCALVSRVHMMFYTLRKGYTVPRNPGFLYCQSEAMIFGFLDFVHF